jgi:dienelactone hydrolase
MMRTRDIQVPLRDGVMGAHVAYPDRTPAGAIIAIMEIWGVNATMRHHAQEFAEAGFVCLVPDLFWRQEPGVELSDGNPEHVKKAFDLYYDFDYDLAVEDMVETWRYLAALPECNGKWARSAIVSAASSVTSCAAVRTSIAPSPTTGRTSSITSGKRRGCTGRSCCTWR